MQKRTSSVLTADGIHLHVTVYEADPGAVVGTDRRYALLLHGWPNAGRVWRDFAEALILADPDWRLFALDQRGFGDSENSTEGYHSATLARDAIAVVSDLFEGGTWELIGHSMGGKIAQIVASRQPEGLLHLVLLTPTPLKTEPLPEAAKAALRAAFGSATGVRDFIESLPAHAPAEERMDAMVEDGLKASRGAWDGWIDTMRDEDFSAAGATITAPTLIVAGGKDKRASVDALQSNVADKIVGARLVVLPGSGHLPHLEEPNALAALVVNFLDSSLPPKGSV